MLPMLPMLRPPIFDLGLILTREEDNEITALENIHNDWITSISRIAMDLTPIGKNTVMGHDTDDDDVNDETDETESHEDEDTEEIEAMEPVRLGESTIDFDQ